MYHAAGFAPRLSAMRLIWPSRPAAARCIMIGIAMSEMEKLGSGLSLHAEPSMSLTANATATNCDSSLTRCSHESLQIAE